MGMTEPLEVALVVMTNYAFAYSRRVITKLSYTNCTARLICSRMLSRNRQAQQPCLFGEMSGRTFACVSKHNGITV